MSDRSMMLVATAANAIEAQIIGARLGAEGMLWDARPTVGAPYSIGAVEVFVEGDRVSEARELLIADDVESVFDEGDHEDDALHDRSLWLFVIALLLLTSFVVVRLMSFG